MTHRTSKPFVLCAEVLAVSHAGTYDIVTRSSLVEEDGQKKAAVDQAPALQPNGAATGNNYYRSEGQNVGNFMTDRPSSRVLAPPGGGSQISFGADSGPGPHGKVNMCCCPQFQLSISMLLLLCNKLDYWCHMCCCLCRVNMVRQTRAPVYSWVVVVVEAVQMVATTIHVHLARMWATFSQTEILPGCLPHLVVPLRSRLVDASGALTPTLQIPSLFDANQVLHVLL